MEHKPKIAPWDTGTACRICENPNVQTHHIFHGHGRRKKSDEYGYTVKLCMRHHVGDNGIHLAKNREYDLSLMREAQEHFEANYGTREDFIREFGKSWL